MAECLMLAEFVIFYIAEAMGYEISFGAWFFVTAVYCCEVAKKIAKQKKGKVE